MSSCVFLKKFIWRSWLILIILLAICPSCGNDADNVRLGDMDGDAGDDDIDDDDSDNPADDDDDDSSDWQDVPPCDDDKWEPRLNRQTKCNENLSCPEGMVFFTGGTARIVYEGKMWNEGGGICYQEEEVAPFCIDIYEASQPDATQTTQGSWVSGATPVPPAVSNAGVLPWKSISQYNAHEACLNSGKRLPSISEWQTAFSGLDSKQWPWDKGFNTSGNDCVVRGYGQPFPTGNCCFLIDGSSTEICDMVGNVSEWLADPWDVNCYGNDQIMVAGGSFNQSPQDKNSQRKDPDNEGCWLFSTYSLHRSGLHAHDPYSMLNDDGFRCAADPNVGN